MSRQTCHTKEDEKTCKKASISKKGSVFFLFVFHTLAFPKLYQAPLTLFFGQSVPAKRKNSTEKANKAKKSKTQASDKVAADGGDDSDSDSSLDVEKWKKLVQQMTGRSVCVCLKKQNSLKWEKAELVGENHDDS